MLVPRPLVSGAIVARDGVPFNVFVKDLRLSAGDVDERGRPPLEIRRRAIDEKVTRVEPAPRAEPAASGGERPRNTGCGGRHHQRVAWNVFGNGVDDLGSRI